MDQLLVGIDIPLDDGFPYILLSLDVDIDLALPFVSVPSTGLGIHKQSSLSHKFDDFFAWDDRHIFIKDR